MHLINVVCSNCGNLLSIPEDVKHATCNGCAMPMTVKQTDSVTFTEPMLLARPEHLEVVPFDKAKAEQNKADFRAKKELNKEPESAETIFPENEDLTLSLSVSNAIDKEIEGFFERKETEQKFPVETAKSDTELALSKDSTGDNEKIYNELERLDRIWEMELEKLERDGALPTSKVSIGLLVFAILGNLGGLLLLAQGRRQISIMAIVLMIGAILSAIIYYINSANYMKNKREYEKIRADLESQLK